MVLGEFKFIPDDIAAVRIFAGFYAGASPISADDPAGDHIGIQFSTARGDTTWQIISKDAAGAQLVINTHASPGLASVRIVRIQFLLNATEVRVEIFGRNYDILASYILSTNLPGLSDRMYAMVGVRTLAAAVKSLKQFYAHTVMSSF